MARATVLLGLLCLLIGGCSNRALGNHGGGGGSSQGGGGGSAGGGSAGGGGSHSGCSGLDQAGCLAQSACHANYCIEDCGSTFVGCTDVGSTRVICEGKEPPALCNCDELDEASCVAAASSSGCTAVYCPTSCSGQMFAGCLGPNSGTIACPVGGNGGCPGGCHSSADCASHTDCLPPDGSTCVACLSPGCSSDGDCGSGQVCDWVGCCGGNQCIPACTSDTDCASQSCAADGHCRPTTCGNGPAGCPVHFDCVAGTCGRHPCSADSDCSSNGYCVDHGCYEQLGVCGPD